MNDGNAANLPSFFYTLTLHLVLFSLIILWEKGVLQFRKDIDISLEQYSMQVDMVGLPDKTLKEIFESKEKIISPPPVPIATPAPAPAPAPEPASSSPKTEKAKEDLLLSGLQEWKKRQIPTQGAKEAAKETSKETLLQKSLQGGALQGLILKGNKIQSGSLRPNMGISLDSPAVAKYIDQVILRIRQQWKLPSEMARLNLKCRIRIGLDKYGRIQLLKIVESSKDPSYDEKAQQAIQGAAPFDTVPEEIQKEISTGSFILGFPL